MLAVRRPHCRAHTMPGMLRQLLKVAAIRSYRPDFIVAGAIGPESDQAAIRRPSRDTIFETVIGELTLAGTISSDHEYIFLLAPGRVRNPLAIRRRIRVSRKAQIQTHRCRLRSHFLG